MIDLESLSLLELLEIKENIDDVINRKKEQILNENNIFNEEEEIDNFIQILKESHTSFDDNYDYWDNHKTR